MPLSISRWTEVKLEDFDPAFPYCEATETVVIRAAWHDDPGTGESVLVGMERVVLNQQGVMTHSDVEEWDYTRAGAPPDEYRRETYATVFLPGLGRGLHHVQSEREIFYPWSNLQPGVANLSWQRTISGIVIYDMSPQPEPLTQEEQDKLEDRGQNPQGPSGLIIDSARRWDEATDRGEIIEESSASQTSIRVEPFTTEVEQVVEEMDKWTITKGKKNHLRPGPMIWGRPEYRKKELWTYPLPVPIDPPKIEATSAGDEGVRLEVTGGGATVNGNRIAPEKYRVLRRTVSEPDRSASGDPFDIWDSDPAPTSRARLWVDTDVTDFAGAPASPLPSQESYTEPGDTSDPPVEGWRLIAEISNAADPKDEGRAVTVDDDVLSGAVYEYVATAIIGKDESRPSERASATYGGADHSSRIQTFVRRTDDGGLEIDVKAPVDPAFPEYGESLVFEDFPILVYDDGSADDFGLELGMRHFADDRNEALEVDLNSKIPIITLERGMKIKIPKVEWTLTGNELVITSETEQKTFELDGFSLGASRSPDGKLTIDDTKLYLTER